MVAEKTWNELTADERACLFNIATSDKAVDGWIWTGDIPHFVRSALDSLIAHGLIEERITSPHRICYVKITPTGFTVYQQGQTPAEPDELARLREQVAALTAERDALKSSVPSLREPVFAIGTRVQLHGAVPRFTVGVVTSVKVYGGCVLKESTWEWVADTGEHVYCIRCDDGAIRHSSRDSMSKVNE